MKDFIKILRNNQIKWKQNHLPDIKEFGKQNGRFYPHILPFKHRWSNFYPDIQHNLPTYLEKNNIQPHTGIHNLMSSWVLCSNMYWPFNNTNGFLLLSDFLTNKTGIDISNIDKMELEYEDEELKPHDLLGEDTGGQRGSGQTSPDLAIIFYTRSQKRGILLIESKFTEHSFYGCSGYHKSKPGKPINPDKNRCKYTKGIIDSDFKDCHLSTWNRKYWDLLKNDLNKELFLELKRCPMTNSCYQLFRQQALAKGLENKYEIVVSCVFTDSRNENLINSCCSVGLKSFPEGWKELFPKLNFQWLTHNDWYSYIKENHSKEYSNWVKYIGERYFL